MINIRRIGFLAVFSLLMFVLSACGLLGEEDVSNEIVSIEVDTDSLEHGYNIYDFDLTKIRIRVHREDGTYSFLDVEESMLNDIDLQKLESEGNHMITVRYSGFSATFPISLYEDTELEEDETLDMTPIHLELKRNYEGTNFFVDGIGEARLERCIDGDTARFIVNNQSFSFRFLAVDAPESTFMFEPWGKAASDFVCDILTNADTIVLEAEFAGAQDTVGRYLGYVWVDGELLQLQIIREGFSRAIGTGMYDNYLRKAQAQAQEEGLRMWGEEDPRFAFVHDIPNLAYLLENYELYEFQRINIRLELVHTGGSPNTIYLSDDSTSETIALYLGPGNWTWRFDHNGNILDFTELVPSYWQNSRQLVNWSRNNTECYICFNE